MTPMRCEAASLRGVCAQQAHGAHRVVDRRIRAVCPPIRGQAITQYGGCETALGEPLRRFDAFLVDDHAHVAAARHDEQRDAVVGHPGFEQRQRRACHVLREPIAQRAVRQPLDDFFLDRDFVAARRATRPKLDDRITGLGERRACAPRRRRR